MTVLPSGQPASVGSPVSDSRSGGSNAAAQLGSGPTPEVGECHALSMRQAVAVVGRTAPVACRRPHTAQTYFVGRLDLATPSGFTRRVDSQAAQRQMRRACTNRLPQHLGRRHPLAGVSTQRVAQPAGQDGGPHAPARDVA